MVNLVGFFFFFFAGIERMKLGEKGKQASFLTKS